MKCMKYSNKLFFFLISPLIVCFINSCTKNLGEETRACNGVPVITSIRLAGKDSTTSLGLKLNSYAVVGSNLKATKQLWINNYEVFVNPAFCTETHVIFSVPAETPWRGDNKLKIKSNCGEVETAFTIQQPPPVIINFFPVVGNAGDTITINGDLFDNATSVTFDSSKATIISVSPTQIKVLLPANIATAFVNVSTPGGTAKSDGAFGFKYIIYDDSRNSGWWEGSWGGNYDQANTTVIKRGTKSIKATYNAAWAAMQFGANTPLSLAGYQGLKISIYGGVGIGTNTTIKVSINDGAKGKVITVKEGQWTDFTILLIELDNPASLKNIWIQEFNGTTKFIYIDDIGLI